MNTQLLINGNFSNGLGNMFQVINPANESILAELTGANAEQVDQAVASAQKAFQLWKNQSDEDIKEIFNKICKALKDEKDEIAELITLEQGKPFQLAQFEVEAGISWIQFIADIAIPVETLQEPNGKKIEVYNRPLGVVASITPWNWPFMIAIWHLFPALKAKNTVVNKPSEYTPLSTIKLVEIMNNFLPAGVCNIVLGTGETGKILTEHKNIAKVTFTGSTATGQRILKNSVDSLKSVVLELGGNDVGIMLPDADIEKAVQGIFSSAFLNMGQTCAALKRLYVHEDIYDDVVGRLADLATSQKIGDGMAPNTTFGPVQNQAQYLKIKKMIVAAVQQGAKVIEPESEIPSTGYFILPTILTHVNESMDIVSDEQFGPVLPVLKFSNAEDVVQLTNNSEFGLGGSVWSRDLKKAHDLAAKMDTGTVWINSHSDLSPAVPFGGWKKSGLGYSFGLDGLLLFTQKQAIHISE